LGVLRGLGPRLITAITNPHLILSTELKLTISLGLTDITTMPHRMLVSPVSISIFRYSSLY